VLFLNDCCLFRCRLSPETFRHTLVFWRIQKTKSSSYSSDTNSFEEADETSIEILHLMVSTEAFTEGDSAGNCLFAASQNLCFINCAKMFEAVNLDRMTV
jgi:hypothetical protein